MVSALSGRSKTGRCRSIVLSSAVLYPSGVVANDPAWQKFQEALNEAMRSQGVTAKKLAHRLGLEVSRVENWKKGRSTPPLSQLPRISMALEPHRAAGETQDPAWLLSHMELLEGLPDRVQVHRLSMQLAELQHRTLQVQEQMSSIAGRRHGATTVLDAALESMEFAAAYWPAIEGPPDCKMYVADRVDLRRVDGHPLDDEAVWAYEHLRQALRAAHAYPSTAGPRWSKVSGRQRGEPGDGISRWVIPHIGDPRAADRQIPHPGLPALAFSALTVESWVHETAALVALALGYGFTTTRALALEVSPVYLGDSPSAGGRSDPTERRIAHQLLTSHAPENMVWSHHSLTTGNFPDPFGNRSGELFHVFLSESDDLLQTYLDDWNHNTPPATLSADRDRLTDLAPERGALVFPVVKSRNRHQRWSQALEISLRVLQHLSHDGRLDMSSSTAEQVQQRQMRRERAVIEPYFTWLNRNGWTVRALPGTSSGG